MSLADDNDDAGDDREVVRVVDVWICNLDAVRVFQLCPIASHAVTVPFGMGSVRTIIEWECIAPSEIRAAIALLRLPRRRWPELVDDVAFMGRCVARERNKRAARQ